MEQDKVCTPPLQVANEIKYYAGYCLLFKLYHQGKINQKQFYRANVGIAEKYEVLPFDI